MNTLNFLINNQPAATTKRTDVTDSCPLVPQ